ncbi:MAG: transposase [Spirochaetales bacterium]|nr:transposase [Spirochaetales bacterium]
MIHKVTNSFSEGVNCKIYFFIHKAYGFRKIKTLINIIYLGCGCLELPTQLL